MKGDGWFVTHKYEFLMIANYLKNISAFGDEKFFSGYLKNDKKKQIWTMLPFCKIR